MLKYFYTCRLYSDKLITIIKLFRLSILILFI
ncbi:hypothetical protein SSP1152 [Staphylococcus saprophyticus subsp. saprophyticus ATCC 15305]|uniref:Uncharacterized protein n=1 Tax=Staphylococcus saprophyticus subsp. saprophyticus (strain ATCC 15305 / DSM 20229 / NCIMB 8711 / NCTC 7292 / S-41) TaxID=342451 RepID=Q49Y47_STAS1|nr:hypothetical protein SSP1152 [Staphylococcus saprophyticus subsp. saprophyticus ATCC 15305] [Staphylococcus saprophyticus subsp. saprophyticus ATCC 15305 = NCTC 7292]